MNVKISAFKEGKDGSSAKINTEIHNKGNNYAFISDLSGGESERVALAFVLGLNEMFGARILMLDEPLASIHGDLQLDLFRFIKERFRDRIVLIVTHDPTIGVFDNKINLL
jgi:ABC-type Mn2+/Zn2+ transport system ATPase subunit